MQKNEFAVLRACLRDDAPSQRVIAQETGLSLGTVNGVCQALSAAGLLEDARITPAGMDALEPYKVDNAVIMAAGLSSRFAPISYEKPKGVLRVRGEVLIERQIRQLHEAGITDITVVVGYKKEEFFYLEDAFGVSIVVNDEYASRNNNSTIKRVADRLGNTYICSSDDYFTENPFEAYVYGSYYAAVYEEGPTQEYCLKTKGRDHAIVGVEVGGADSWVMMGHVFWDRAFSQRFCEILDAIYDLPETAGKLWEDIYIDHIDELPMVMRAYEPGVIWEFDSLDELRVFDPEFIDNVDSEIMDNICSVLGCARCDIAAITPIKQGLTNLSFRFDVGKASYVYRHPGAGTEEIINRASEAFSQGVAKKLGIDDTFVYEDPQQGWKISRFIPDCIEFDYHNDDHVTRGLELARRLHTSGDESPWTFDVYQNAVDIVNMLDNTDFQDFDVLADRAKRLNEFVRADGVAPCLCHNDFYAPNFLVRVDEMYLIDWEYSAMSDYASDLGTFICCSDYTVDEARGVIEKYFGRAASPEEMRHCLAYVGLSAYYWFVWALYKDATGDPVGEWLYLWYRAAKTYGKLALELYGA